MRMTDAKVRHYFVLVVLMMYSPRAIEVLPVVWMGAKDSWEQDCQ